MRSNNITDESVLKKILSALKKKLFELQKKDGIMRTTVTLFCYSDVLVVLGRKKS